MIKAGHFAIFEIPLIRFNHQTRYLVNVILGSSISLLRLALFNIHISQFNGSKYSKSCYISFMIYVFLHKSTHLWNMWVLLYQVVTTNWWHFITVLLLFNMYDGDYVQLPAINWSIASVLQLQTMNSLYLSYCFGTIRDLNQMILMK